MWPKLNQKAYWATLKSFTNWKKIPVVSPLLMNDYFVTNFNKKKTIVLIIFLSTAASYR